MYQMIYIYDIHNFLQYFVLFCMSPLSSIPFAWHPASACLLGPLAMIHLNLMRDTSEGRQARGGRGQGAHSLSSVVLLGDNPGRD